MTGLDIAPDGTVVVRSDVGNIYRWSGRYTSTLMGPSSHKWEPMLTIASLMATAGGTPSMVTNVGAYDLVIAPTLTTNFYGIMGDPNGAVLYWVYYSTDSGTTWTKSNLSLANAGSNSTFKNYKQKIAVDPNNKDVVYVGMPVSSGNAFGLYRAIDGLTFNAVTEFVVPTFGAGCTGIIFDDKSGTVVVGGQTRTARIIVPLGGVGIYESLDGGVTWTETFVAQGASASFDVYVSRLNYSSQLFINASGRLWRYSGPAGTWVNLFAAAGWSFGATYLTSQGEIFCDPRAGHEGYMTVAGPNGVGVGYTSNNVNGAAASVTWAGATGGQVITLVGPAYDVPWLSFVLPSTTKFLSGRVFIDHNGDCWSCGNQGAIWKWDAIPDYSVSLESSLTTASRGSECTVAQDVCRPPGSPYPVMATQDVGVMRGEFEEYPTDFYISADRVDCNLLDWASSDPSFLVSKVDRADGNYYGAAYSANFGATGSWVPYTNQPNTSATVGIWQGAGTADISNGAGGSGTVLNVSAVSAGNILVDQTVTIGGVAKGTITAQVSGVPHGVGVYTISAASLTASGAATFIVATESGQIIASDHDHHVVVPMGFQGKFIPAYTANATGATTWNLCNGLPSVAWLNRSFVVGVNARALAADRVDIGTMYALDIVTNLATFVATCYISTDHGANWTVSGTITSFGGGGNYTSPFLYSVPGKAGHLWATARFTGSTGCNLWRSTNYGATWSAVTKPGNIIVAFTLGKESPGATYPTLFVGVRSTSAAETTLYYSINEGVNWILFGTTGTRLDLPPVMQLQNILGISGGWGTFKELYVMSGTQCGYAYYNP